MRALQLFFRLHRPYELRPEAEWGDQGYFGGDADFREANRTAYQPLFALLERNTQKFPKFRVSLAVSGVWLEQAQRLDPDLIRRLRRLVERGKVEILAEPYYYSLASFYNHAEFVKQMADDRQKVLTLLGAECKVLAMPELIYHDKIAAFAKEAGFKGVLAGAAEKLLDWRSANQVFDVYGVDGVRVIFQNTRFSKAMRVAGPLVMEYVVEKPTEFVTESDEGVVVPKSSRRTTAAEFVKGMGATANKTQASAKGSGNSLEVTEQLKFSARKLQKELDLECLRGNLVNLCLDAEMLAAYRELGVVRFFDELISGWLKVSGNHFYTASEMLDAMEPKLQVSVKTTIDWYEPAETTGGGLALLKDVYYCPPEYRSNARQIRAEKKLYALYDDVLRTKDQGLLTDFERLTDLTYLGKAKLAQFEQVLDHFAAQVLAKQPEPLKLTVGGDAGETEAVKVAGTRKKAGSVRGVAGGKVRTSGVAPEAVVDGGKARATDGGDKAGVADDEVAEITVKRIKKKPVVADSKIAESEAEKGAGRSFDEPSIEEEDFSVKVHRITKKREAVEQKKDSAEEVAEQEADAADDWDDLIWEVDDWGIDEDEPAMDETEEAEQILAERLLRQREAVEKNVNDLAEAEVVETKKQIKKKIVLE